MEVALTFAPRVGPRRLTFTPRITLECHSDHVVWRADPVHFFLDTRVPIRIQAAVRGPVPPTVCCLTGDIDVAGVTPHTPASQTLVQDLYVWHVHATSRGSDCVTVTLTAYAPRSQRDTTAYVAATQLLALSQQPTPVPICK